MDTHRVTRRVSALIMVITVSLIGVPLPAAGQEDVAVTCHRSLTINGRPLSQLLRATATPKATIPENGGARIDHSAAG